jgi:hypothetical protein
VTSSGLASPVILVGHPPSLLPEYPSAMMALLWDAWTFCVRSGSEGQGNEFPLKPLLFFASLGMALPVEIRASWAK